MCVALLMVCAHRRSLSSHFHAFSVKSMHTIPMKAAVAVLILASATVSSGGAADAPACSPNCTIHSGVQCPDKAYKWVTVATVAECCAACTANFPTCGAFAFVTTGHGPRKPGVDARRSTLDLCFFP